MARQIAPCEQYRAAILRGVDKLPNTVRSHLVVVRAAKALDKFKPFNKPGEAFGGKGYITVVEN